MICKMQRAKRSPVETWQFDMYVLLSVLYGILLRCIFAEAQGVDYSQLTLCHKKTDCLPWQECADCKYTNLDEVRFGYCSDVSLRDEQRGLCGINYFSTAASSQGYEDEYFSCTCQRNVLRYSLDKGECREDTDCDGDERCATCITDATTNQFHNFCTYTSDILLGSDCDSISCSCGQRLAQNPISENTQPRNQHSSYNQNIAKFGNSPLPLTLADAQIENGQIGVEPVNLEQVGSEPINLDQNSVDAVEGGNFPLLFLEGGADQV